MRSFHLTYMFKTLEHVLFEMDDHLLYSVVSNVNFFCQQTEEDLGGAGGPARSGNRLIRNSYKSVQIS